LLISSLRDHSWIGLTNPVRGREIRISRSGSNSNSDVLESRPPYGVAWPALPSGNRGREYYSPGTTRTVCAGAENPHIAESSKR
jgi:hypothetical protein